MKTYLQAGEIKKGNLLRFAVGNAAEGNVYEASEDATEVEGGEPTVDGYPLSFFQPIAITPKLMRASGFVQRPNEPAIQREDVIFLELPSAAEGLYEYIINVEYANGEHRIHNLSYVHELQNFYTADLERRIEIVL